MRAPLVPVGARVGVETLSGPQVGTITEHLPMCVGGIGYMVRLDGGGFTFESRESVTG